MSAPVPSLVQSVARAICGAEGCYNPDELAGHGAKGEPNWRFHVREAEAAIRVIDAERSRFHERRKGDRRGPVDARYEEAFCDRRNGIERRCPF